MDIQDFYNQYSVGDTVTIKVGDSKLKVDINELDPSKKDKSFKGEILNGGKVEYNRYKIKNVQGPQYNSLKWVT